MSGKQGKRFKQPNLSDSPGRILVIEVEPEHYNAIEAPLKKVFPYVQFTFAKTGLEGWAHAMESEFDFVIMDWKPDGELSGLGLLNRLRQHEFYQYIPVLILSEDLTESDVQLLKEFSYTSVLSKPFKAQLLTRSSKDIFNDAKWCLKQRGFVNRFFEEICTTNETETRHLKIEDFLESCPHPQPILLMATKMLREAGDYTAALEVVLKSHRHTVGNPMLDASWARFISAWVILKRLRLT